VAPAEFIPFAEQTGFIRTLTMWVFEEAARHWQTLNDDGIELQLSVNLSTRDLMDPELPQKFDTLLSRHGVRAKAFCLEITESAIMDDPQRALVTLDRLSAMGFKLSIDDFGTGWASLSYLSEIQSDEIKIDKRFIQAICHNPRDRAIVASTIQLARSLGQNVVAEGVEDLPTMRMLQELECDIAQGYLIGRPVRFDEFVRSITVAPERRQFAI